MLYTLKQTQDAIEEIIDITQWNETRLAKNATLPLHTIQGVRKGTTTLPRQSTMDRIEKLLNKVRKI